MRSGYAGRGFLEGCVLAQDVKRQTDRIVNSKLVFCHGVLVVGFLRRWGAKWGPSPVMPQARNPASPQDPKAWGGHRTRMTADSVHGCSDFTERLCHIPRTEKQYTEMREVLQEALAFFGAWVVGLMPRR